MIGQLHVLWNDLWPNTIAPSAWSLAAIGASHWRQMREHRKTREHIGNNHGSEAK